MLGSLRLSSWQPGGQKEVGKLRSCMPTGNALFCGALGFSGSKRGSPLSLSTGNRALSSSSLPRWPWMSWAPEGSRFELLASLCVLG